MAVTTDKVGANRAHTYYDFDPDDANATEIAWVDMRDYETFYCAFIRTVGTGALDTFKIMANPASDGSGTDVDIVTHAVGSEPDAVGDYIQLECTREQIADLARVAGVENVRYVTCVAEFATATDEGVIHYERSALRPQDGLTADSIA